MKERYNGRDDKQNEVFSKKVKAGKRTYFFDVKTTKSKDYYLTITESRKIYSDDDDSFEFEKHKIFLYKEDFEKFLTAFTETVDYIKNDLYDGTELERVHQPREEMDMNGNYKSSDLDWENL